MSRSLRRRAAAAVCAAASVTTVAGVAVPAESVAQEAAAPAPGVWFTVAGRESTYGVIVGTSVSAGISNLPLGAKVTAVGPKGVNFLAAPVEATLDPRTGRGAVNASGLVIPGDAALVGKRMFVTYEVGGVSTTFDGHVLIAADVKASGAERFTLTKGELDTGLYQSAYSAKSNALYVTRTEWTDTGAKSSVFKLDPATLAVQRVVEVAADNAVFGLAVDDATDTVWVTNSVSDSVAVYRQSDLGLVKQFDSGIAPHARAIVVDQSAHRAYVSLPTDAEGGVGKILVFDTEHLLQTGRITLPGFGGPMDLDLDAKTGELFTVSLDQPKAARIDARGTGAFSVFALPNNPGDSPSGVAWDPVKRNIWAASQGTNNVIAVNVDSGKVVAELPAGNGALDTAYDPVHHLVYAASFGASVVSVYDADKYTLLANIEVGPNVNHVSVDGKGNAYAVNKGGHTAADRPGAFNYVTRLTPAFGKGGLGSAGSLDIGGSLGNPAGSLGSLTGSLG